MSTDEMMMERMADSFSQMSEGEMLNWSREEAGRWVADEVMYAQQHNREPLPFNAEDVYDTIRAMIETEERRITL